MLRTRLLTSLAFNAILAIWVYHDARERAARKPAFAAVLTLVWGPLGFGFWQSDRPLGAGERRGKTSAAIARGFLFAWVGLLPAVFVLAMQAVEYRAAVPGSLGRQIGIVPATLVAVGMAWGVPALLAWIVSRSGQRLSAVDLQTARSRARVPAWVAVAVAGAVALACALTTRPT